jgi:hypothetical protein
MRHETRANFRSVRSFHRRRGEKCPDAGALRISHAFGGREQQSGRIHNNGWRGRLTLPFANAHPTLINSPASQAASSSGTSSKFTKCPAGRSAYHYSSLLRTAAYSFTSTPKIDARTTISAVQQSFHSIHHQHLVVLVVNHLQLPVLLTWAHTR